MYVSIWMNMRGPISSEDYEVATTLLARHSTLSTQHTASNLKSVKGWPEGAFRTSVFYHIGFGLPLLPSKHASIVLVAQCPPERPPHPITYKYTIYHSHVQQMAKWMITTYQAWPQPQSTSKRGQLNRFVSESKSVFPELLTVRVQDTVGISGQSRQWEHLILNEWKDNYTHAALHHNARHKVLSWRGCVHVAI